MQSCAKSYGKERLRVTSENSHTVEGADVTFWGRLFQNFQLRAAAKIVVKILQGSVVTQTTLGGLAIYPPVANFL